MNLFKERIMLVFPSGAKVNDKSGLLEGDYKDGRRITIFKDIKDVKAKGVDTFIDCTPAYLGRDASILKRLSDTAGINVLTTTGYYGAVNEKFVPKHAYSETAQQLADRWITEWNNGIEGTSIKPGLIKTSTDKGPLTPMQRKLIQAEVHRGMETGAGNSERTGRFTYSKDLGACPERNQ